MSKKIIIATVSAIVSVGIATEATAADPKIPKMKKGLERCYGISKAGKNECGTATAACAGTAKVDNDKNAWIVLPKGTCDKIVGGSTKPPEGSNQGM